MPVGLIVGHLHIIAGKKPPTENTRRRFVRICLDHLAGLSVSDWAGRPEFPVARLPLGDCNLALEDAQAAAQDCKDPISGTTRQRAGGLKRWEVSSTVAELSPL